MGTFARTAKNRTTLRRVGSVVLAVVGRIRVVRGRHSKRPAEYANRGNDREDDRTAARCPNETCREDDPQHIGPSALSWWFGRFIERDVYVVVNHD